ncbi:MAG TPA: SdrD B-like domain-containing protein [Gemmatimonadales bacterium]|nr:SdrD B-like domain-containing protein [Gemmatimonadales bacterium]
MKSVRVLFAVVGLSALPLFAVAAQGRSASANSGTACAAAVKIAGQSGKVPPGQAKKCPDPVPPPPPPAPVPPPPPAPVPPPPPAPVPPPPPPPPPPPAPVPPPPPPPPAPVPPPPPPPPPPPSSPPSGVNRAKGMVFGDVDGNGAYDPFSGDTLIVGATVQLKWNGQVIAAASTDGNGDYDIGGLGNSSYEVCIINDGGYALTVPVNGNGCGGSGYAFSFNSAFEAWAVNNFAFLQP